MLQGGLGLPEREYYLSSDPKMAGIRDDYKAYIAKLLTAAGIADADAKAARVYDLEMKIAKAHATREESEDFTKSATRSEEHTSELQSLMRISYAVFCLKKKNNKQTAQRKYYQQ